MKASEAFQRLVEGNQRFVRGEHSTSNQFSPEQRAELVSGQAPFAVILSCADSRAPAEIVFDQSLGDLFVVRVAGNIAAESQIGSIEYAVEHLGCELIVVMGHSHCGAVSASLKEALDEDLHFSPDVSTITRRIEPAIKHAIKQGPDQPEDVLLTMAIDANVENTVASLREHSGLLCERVAQQRLSVIGARYDLATGEVRFFDAVS